VLNIKFSRNGSDHVLYLFIDLEIENLSKENAL